MAKKKKYNCPCPEMSKELEKELNELGEIPCTEIRPVFKSFDELRKYPEFGLWENMYDLVLSQSN